MATIHLAGSIVLFLFGGVITLFGLVSLDVSNPVSDDARLILGLSGFHFFVIGVFMIVTGVFVAQMSKSKWVLEEWVFSVTHSKSFQAYTLKDTKTYLNLCINEKLSSD